MCKHNHRIVASLDVGNGYLKAQLQTRTAGSPLVGTSVADRAGWIVDGAAGDVAA